MAARLAGSIRITRRGALRLASAFACLVALAGRSPSAGAESVDLVDPVDDFPDSSLARAIYDLLGSVDAKVAVAVKHLGSGKEAYVNGTRVFEAASLYKLAVMVELYHQISLGEISLDDQFTVADIVGYGDDDLPIYGASYPYPVADTLDDMITVSDNDAAQLLLFRLGPERINQTMADLGLEHTRVDYDTSTCALDMVRLLEMIATGKAVDRESSRQMLAVLLDQQINDRIPAGLPDGTRVAHKTGNLPGLVHDVGIVYGPTGPHVIAVLTEDLDDDAGAELIRRIAGVVHDQMSGR